MDPTGTKKEAVFCMTLRLADTIWDLILISLFIEINWTKQFFCLKLQNVKPLCTYELITLVRSVNRELGICVCIYFYF